jgi:hypothetical protein
MSDNSDEQPAAIELRRCLYQVRCNVRACQAKATIIARSAQWMLAVVR